MKGKKQVIYAILNIINGKSYIGSAINFDRRKKTHLRLLNKNSHHSIKLQNAYNKYGVDSFLFKIIEEIVNVENIIQREQFWLDKLKPEYNMTLTAGLNSHLGLKRSEETKKKISESLKGRKLSKEHIEAMKKGLTGIKQTDEAKKNRSSACKNSEVFQKAVKSKERNDKIKKTRVENGGYIVTDEQKKQISETLKKTYEQIKSPVAIKIEKYSMDGELLETYSSMTEAEEKNNFYTGAVSLIFRRSKNNKYKNFIWKKIF